MTDYESALLRLEAWKALKGWGHIVDVSATGRRLSLNSEIEQELVDVYRDWETGFAHMAEYSPTTLAVRELVERFAFVFMQKFHTKMTGDK